MTGRTYVSTVDMRRAFTGCPVCRGPVVAVKTGLGADLLGGMCKPATGKCNRRMASAAVERSRNMANNRFPSRQRAVVAGSA